jgi:phage/plasmid-like protein (TIGR03299 family)
MSHALEIVNGQASMMYVGATPWHGLGQKLNENPSIKEAIEAAGLNWKVETQNLFLADGTQAPSKAVVREGKNDILGVVGPGYTPLQNIEAFEFFQDFLDSNQASLHTAGSLRDGKRIWVLAKINKSNMEIVKGDEIEKYVLLSNSHDGTMSVRAGFTPIRVVCANTLGMAHAKRGGSNLIRLKHTKNLKQNLENVAEIMNLANQQFEATAEQYRALASSDINQSDLEKYVKLVFVGPGYEKMEQAGKKPARDVLPKVVELFENGRGAQLPGVRGTYWAAYNAVNEYLGYAKGNDQQARLDKYWFGDSATTNQKALDLALELVS